MSVALRSRLEWCRFLGSYNNDMAADEIRRMARHLSYGFDAVNYVLQALSGSPSCETEETLRVARTAIAEAMDEIEAIARQLRYQTLNGA